MLALFLINLKNQEIKRLVMGKATKSVSWGPATVTISSQPQRNN